MVLPRSARTWTLVVFGVFALAIVVAIWSLPGFLVQDSPLYLYNTHLIHELLRSQSPFQEYFVLDGRPMPYWGAYALLGALMTVLPPRVADQVLMTLTSVGLATAVVWLRWRVAGWQGGAIVALLVIVLSVNVLWMYGIHNFLLGAILYVATLAYWWRVRDRMGAGHAAVLALLLLAGYFAHLMSFVPAAMGVGVLALLTPGDNFRTRFKWTALSLVPCVPLVLFYFGMMGAEGQGSPYWKGLTDMGSSADWLKYLFMADFPSFQEYGMKSSGGPILDLLFFLPPPSRFALIGLCLIAGGAFLHRSEEDRVFYRLHRGWTALAAVLLVGGALGPSDMGTAAGTMRERMLLLGFVALVPVLKVKTNLAFTRTGACLVAMAAIGQVILCWDYALKSNRLVGEFMKVKPHVGTNQRVAAVVETWEWPYRTNPLIHAPSLLGIHTGNMIWNNHAPALNFFPIKYRNAELRTLSSRVSDRRYYDDPFAPGHREAALNAYVSLMERSHESIDFLVLISPTPELFEHSGQWFEPAPVYESTRMKVLRHRSN